MESRHIQVSCERQVKSSGERGAYQGRRSLIAGVGASTGDRARGSRKAGRFPPCSHHVSKSRPVHTCHRKLFSNSEAPFTLQEAASWRLLPTKYNGWCLREHPIFQFVDFIRKWKNLRIHTHTRSRVKKTNTEREGGETPASMVYALTLSH